MIEPILLSLRIAAIATLFSGLIGTLLAYKLSKKENFIKDFLEVMIILPMILPPSVTGYLLLILIGKRGPIGSFLLENFDYSLVFTWVAAVLAAAIVSLPLMYQNAKAAFLGVEEDYIKIARTLGASEKRIFFTITLPLAKAGLISGIVLTFARSIGEFGATLMVAGNIPGKTQTIPTAIYFANQRGDNASANILVGIMVAFSFILIFTLNRWMKKRGKEI